MEIAVWSLRALGAWMSIGLVFGLAFVARGVQRIDPAAASSGWGLRLLLLPGCLLFWPRLAALWWRGRTLPVESSSHRRAARAHGE